MPTVVLRGGDKKEAAKKLLKKQPLLVLFFMDGCSHCEANKPAWEEAKKNSKVPTAEIEASATPDGEANGFPTMKYGSKTISGQKGSGDEILNELNVPKKSSGGRSNGHRTGRRVNRLRGGKSRHRTLRSYVSF